MGKDIQPCASLVTMKIWGHEGKSCSTEACQSVHLDLDAPGGDCSAEVQLHPVASIEDAITIDMDITASATSKSNEGALLSKTAYPSLLQTGASLSDLPVEMLVQLVKSTAVVGTDSVIHLALTCKKFKSACKVVFEEDPAVLRAVRQNQLIFQEIRVQLERERQQQERPLCLITKCWTNYTGSPSIWKVMFYWPSTFPYFPSCLYVALAFFLITYAAGKLQSCDQAESCILIANFVIHGGVVGSIGVFCLQYVWLNYKFFLTGLSILFNILLASHGGIVACSCLVFILGEHHICVLLLMLSFALSLWMLLKHMHADFRPGVSKTNVVASIVLSSLTSIYFLLHIK